MPTEQDKLDLLFNKSNGEIRENIDDTNNVLSPIEVLALYIKKIVIKEGNDDKSDIVLTDKKNEIIPCIVSTPIDIRSKILEDDTIDYFAEYMPDFYFNMHCEKCKHEWKLGGIDPEVEFFRQASSVY
jgi:hypothetical protein